MLKLQFVDGSRESIWLVEPRLRIGRLAGNDVVLQEPEIKDSHAEIRLKDEQLYLLNRHPDYLVTVNGKRVKKAVKIGENDLIELGSFELKIVSPALEIATAKPAPVATENEEWGLQATASWASQSFYPVEGTVTIGRDESCDITVPVSHLSRKHAQLTVSGSYMVVKDLGSTNGTFLNGEKITHGRARPGDKLRFDVVNFSVTGPQSDVDQTIVRPVSAAVTQQKASSQSTPPVTQHKSEEQVNTRKRATETSMSSNDQPVEKSKNVVLYTIFGFIVVFGALSAFFLYR